MIQTTVVIPCFNAAQYLRETLTSVLKQNTPTNVIAVDDGSTDNTWDILMEYHNTGSLIALSQEHGGLGKAMNTGVENTKTPYYIHLSADDLIRPDFITLAEDVLDHLPDIDVVLPKYQTFGKSEWIWDLPGFSDELYQNNTILFSSLTRKSLWSKLGGFEEHMPYSGIEDWEFWVRAHDIGAKSYKLASIGIDYRLHETNMTNTTAAPHMDVLGQWMRDHGRMK
jgi:glycosyltransferase involved in cell wall biosynthesis